MFKKMMLISLLNMALTATYYESGVRLNFGINLPISVAPANPVQVAPAPVHPGPAPVQAPPPIYVRFAPAPENVPPPPAPAYRQSTPIPNRR